MLASNDQSEALLQMFEAGEQLDYKKGEYIIRPGQAPTGVFFIKSGLVKAFNITKYGEENLLIIRKEHEVFPLIWAVTGQERHIIYEAVTPTELLRIDRDKFDKTLRKRPDILVPVTDMVVEMYRIHSERIINLQYRSVRERLISFLLTMSRRFGKEGGDGLIIIDVPLRHQDIASSINASRETTSRAMRYLEECNLISNKQSIIKLLDVDKLNSYL